MAKRTPKKLTKRERKALEGKGNAQALDQHQHHIHCVACGAHLEPAQFNARPATAQYIRCKHESRFACCTGCRQEAERRLEEHDRSGQPVQSAAAWH